jgi:hypothetical protein
MRGETVSKILEAVVLSRQGFRVAVSVGRPGSGDNENDWNRSFRSGKLERSVDGPGRSYKRYRLLHE